MDSRELARRIRLHSLNMTHRGHSSHIASALSVADIIAVLYTDILRVNPLNPEAEDRDRFILSKGHAGAAVYAALAECGFFPVSDLDYYYMDGSALSGHVSRKMVPGVDFSTGSLGHGAATACGMALAARKAAKPYRVYTVIGDGECNEGVIWEMALTANQYALDNLTVIIDRNGMQAMGFCRELLNTEPMDEKWRSFGWEVVDVADGNNHEQLRWAFNIPTSGRPKCIIARTVKGKGVSFMENNLLWHYRDPQGEMYDQAVKELNEHRVDIVT